VTPKEKIITQREDHLHQADGGESIRRTVLERRGHQDLTQRCKQADAGEQCQADGCG